MMDEKTARSLVAETGRKLLETGLVARTWGNVSCRVDERTMVITPSGMSYALITDEDTVKTDILRGTWNGDRKPSGERGVHMAAYKCFPEKGFVIHTHQLCASALSLAGFDRLVISGEERERLGGVALASYGLPGTKKLTKNVETALRSGAETVLMAKHGALICAKDRDEALEKALLLETVCRRSLKSAVMLRDRNADLAVFNRIHEALPDTEPAVTDALLYCANEKKPVPVQLDDMAQMIGGKIRVARGAGGAVRKLKRRNAVLVPGLGAVVRAATADDRAALKTLADKAAVCCLHTEGCGERSRIGFAETLLMHTVYKLSYSKRKE